MINNKIKGISKLLVGIILLCNFTGCDKKVITPPELLEPVTKNDAYRVCDRGIIGNAELIYGIVVPTEHCHFWKTAANIAEIYVKPGDYVKAGDKLAACNTELISHEVSELENAIALEQGVMEKRNRIFEYAVKEQEYIDQFGQVAGDQATRDAAAKQLEILREDNRYDNLLSEHRIDDLRKKLSKKRELLSDCYLYARVDGCVSYVKDISYDSSYVSENENIVVIADYDDCYVELPEIGIDKNMKKTYPKLYSYQSKKKCKLEYYDYEPAEVLIAESKREYPNVRLKYENESDMPECGSMVPVIAYGKCLEDVLRIGQDSVYEDSQGSYVYVKNDTGREKRYVTLGTTDYSNVEVIDGIVEGEKVYYVSETVMPEEYSEYEVSHGNFEVKALNTGYSVEHSYTKRYYSECEGTVESLRVSEGSKVTKGELICTVRTNEGGASLKELSNQIDNLKDQHNLTVLEFDKQIQALYELADSISTAANSASSNDVEASGKSDVSQEKSEDNVTPDDEQIASQTDAEKEIQDPYIFEELDCQVNMIKLSKEIEELEYNNQLGMLSYAYGQKTKNNDGTGLVSIYAEANGMVKQISAREGKNVIIGDMLYNLEVESDTFTLLKGDAPLSLSQKVSFVDDNDESFEGRVVGYTGNKNKNYITSVEDKVYITKSDSTSGAIRYYVEMDDAFYEKDRNCNVSYMAVEIKDVVVLPGTMLGNEKSAISQKQTKHFVWKIVDGEMEKYYVDAINTSVDGSSAGLILSGLSDGDILANEGRAE